jgi:hypothetical protein
MCKSYDQGYREKGNQMSKAQVTQLICQGFVETRYGIETETSAYHQIFRSNLTVKLRNTSNARYAFIPFQKFMSLLAGRCHKAGEVRAEKIVTEVQVLFTEVCHGDRQGQLSITADTNTDRSCARRVAE